MYIILNISVQHAICCTLAGDNLGNKIMKEYKVRFFEDNIYKVVKIDRNPGLGFNEITVFQGTLSDCEAWIRLDKEGYFN